MSPIEAYEQLINESTKTRNALYDSQADGTAQFRRITQELMTYIHLRAQLTKTT